MRIVERAVVAARREGVISASEYHEEGSVAGATREALVRLVHRSLKDDDYQTALHAAIELYKIMRDEDYRDIARKVAKKMGISLDLL